MCLLCSCLSICIRADGWFENLEGKVLNNEKNALLFIFICQNLAESSIISSYERKYLHTSGPSQGLKIRGGL